jgi:hypothetical protein
MKHLLAVLALVFTTCVASAQVTHNVPTNLLGFYGKVLDGSYANLQQDSVDIAMGDADSLYVVLAHNDTSNVKVAFRRIPYPGASVADMVSEVKADSSTSNSSKILVLHRGLTTDQRGYYGIRIVLYYAATTNSRNATFRNRKLFARVVRVY